MLKAVIDAEAIKDAVEAVSSLVDEVKFAISEKGLELKAVDPANVAMVSLKVDSSAFQFFKATPGEIGIDLVRLSDLLSMADRGESVSLELDEESHKLKIGVGSLSYTLSLIDPSAIRKEPRIPELDLPAHVTLTGAELRRAVKAAEKVSDHVVLGVADDMFYMEAKGDIDALKLTIPSSELLGLKPGQARSLFSLDYLSDMSKSIGKASEVKLELGVDYPLRIGFRIKEVEISYLLAPRIEQE
ncbi:MAG: DNA polymerase sliding clamp [Methanosaeta sp. PtaB.Bin039]|nr:MAG: DNA polymerase sliding clamp [Methanosaeta sp. PtaB.Bin039]OPY44280.1 MAG: DNA polymerase sliding clamp [Methanosaeta sp. PtaU1.Bin028]HOT07973.1 DNA polymerase sliding clamp [Methanotrichaceae archaeon]HQF17715.1 DNA polymerase sliding clamp [Methanotrichaceae archaeon]HQI92330.1 DNA polymerase sliding clamp [Methanotrichaceae archaeon]